MQTLIAKPTDTEGEDPTARPGSGGGAAARLGAGLPSRCGAVCPSHRPTPQMDAGNPTLKTRPLWVDQAKIQNKTAPLEISCNRPGSCLGWGGECRLLGSPAPRGWVGLEGRGITIQAPKGVKGAAHSALGGLGGGKQLGEDHIFSGLILGPNLVGNSCRKKKNPPSSTQTDRGGSDQNLPPCRGPSQSLWGWGGVGPAAVGLTGLVLRPHNAPQIQLGGPVSGHQTM